MSILLRLKVPDPIWKRSSPHCTVPSDLKRERACVYESERRMCVGGGERERKKMNGSQRERERGCVCACVCVCVCERVRERERERVCV